MSLALTNLPRPLRWFVTPVLAATAPGRSTKIATGIATGRIKTGRDLRGRHVRLHGNRENGAPASGFGENPVCDVTHHVTRDRFLGELI